MEIVIKEIGTKIKKKERDYSYFKIKNSMMEIGWRIKNKVSEFTNIMMEQSIKDSG